MVGRKFIPGLLVLLKLIFIVSGAPIHSMLSSHGLSWHSASPSAHSALHNCMAQPPFGARHSHTLRANGKYFPLADSFHFTNYTGDDSAGVHLFVVTLADKFHGQVSSGFGEIERWAKAPSGSAKRYSRRHVLLPSRLATLDDTQARPESVVNVRRLSENMKVHGEAVAASCGFLQPDVMAGRNTNIDEAKAVFNVHMFIGYDQPTAEQLIKGWEDALVKLGVESPSTMIKHSTLKNGWADVVVSCGTVSHSARVVLFLSHRPSVLYVMPVAKMQLRNKWSHWVLQSAEVDNSPFWDAGIKGSNQVIGIGDTGLDSKLCFFDDSSASPPFVKVSSSNQIQGTCPALPTEQHRKLKGYFYYAETDTGDTAQGHGTHVCGSAVGNAGGQQLSEYNGMAPDAKLSFVDISNGGSLWLPDDLTTGYFPCLYESGARISSNSWGGQSSAYDLAAAEFDKFAVEHDDMLMIVAAGNDGANGRFTVGTPATAKNVVAVGASMNAREAFTEQGAGTMAISFRETIATCVPGENSPSPKCYTGSKEMEAVAVSPLDACQPLNDNYSGKIAVVKRGTCSFDAKIKAAVNAGAAAVIVFDNTNGGLVSMQQSIKTPNFFISAQDGNQLLDAISAGRTNVKLFQPASSSSTGIQNAAGFSSTGPTADGRLKPDIMAPGTPILSSYADSRNTVQCAGQCAANPNVGSMSGTSMATPLVAGMAALMRQYLADGRYPDGQPDQSRSISNPSSALMRSLIISSGKQMTGMQPGQAEGLGEIPSIMQGYGRMLLQDVLPPSFPPSHYVWLSDRDITFTASGQVRSFAFNVKAGRAFRVSIAWTDPVPEASQIIALTNDVDLLVSGPDGSSYQGNGGAASLGARDELNNQEMVLVDTPAEGTWTVSVASRTIATKQMVAIAVTAASGSSLSGQAEPKCFQSCSGHGECVSSSLECKCEKGWAGPGCAVEVTDIQFTSVSSKSKTVKASLQPYQWAYYQFTAAADGKATVYFGSKQGSTGDVDMYFLKGAGTTPGFSQNEGGDNSCDNCVDPDTGKYESCDGGCDVDSSGPLCSVTRCRHSFEMDVKSGEVIILAATAFCCQDAVYELVVDAPQSFSMLKILGIVAGVLCAVVLLAAVITFIKNRRRQALYRGQGLGLSGASSNQNRTVVQLPDAGMNVAMQPIEHTNRQQRPPTVPEASAPSAEATESSASSRGGIMGRLQRGRNKGGYGQLQD